MLAGVGGCTIAEAKERMSFEEAVAWSEYMRLRGSLNLGMRLEVGFALIAKIINNALGGKAELSDFTPHIEQNSSLADIAALLSGKR